jgi:hypothetical protein
MLRSLLEQLVVIPSSYEANISFSAHLSYLITPYELEPLKFHKLKTIESFIGVYNYMAGILFDDYTCSDDRKRMGISVDRYCWYLWDVVTKNASNIYNPIVAELKQVGDIFSFIIDIMVAVSSESKDVRKDKILNILKKSQSNIKLILNGLDKILTRIKNENAISISPKSIGLVKKESSDIVVDDEW